MVRQRSATAPSTGTDIDDQKQVELRLEAQNAYLLDEIRTGQNFGDMVGGSSGLQKVMQQVQLVAPTDATVLITGESGTGKELVARAIHEQGWTLGAGFRPNARFSGG